MPDTVGRYLRAFVVALRMTLRGETSPPPKHAALRRWIAQTITLTDAALEVAPAERRKIVVKFDRRDTNMEVILNGVRYHAAQEYPYLLRDDSTHNLTAIYASNLNDQHRVSRLVEALDRSEIKAAVQRLSDHLTSIPQVD